VYSDYISQQQRAQIKKVNTARAEVRELFGSQWHVEPKIITSCVGPRTQKISPRKISYQKSAALGATRTAPSLCQSQIIGLG
jgi:hypothetical protein